MSEAKTVISPSDVSDSGLSELLAKCAKRQAVPGFHERYGLYPELRGSASDARTTFEALDHLFGLVAFALIGALQKVLEVFGPAQQRCQGSFHQQPKQHHQQCGKDESGAVHG